jgi:hypothetical protein
MAGLSGPARSDHPGVSLGSTADGDVRAATGGSSFPGVSEGFPNWASKGFGSDWYGWLLLLLLESGWTWLK